MVGNDRPCHGQRLVRSELHVTGGRLHVEVLLAAALDAALVIPRSVLVDVLRQRWQRAAARESHRLPRHVVRS